MDGSLFVCMVVISVVEMVLVAWVFAKAILERWELGFEYSETKLKCLQRV